MSVLSHSATRPRVGRVSLLLVSLFGVLALMGVARTATASAAACPTDVTKVSSHSAASNGQTSGSLGAVVTSGKDVTVTFTLAANCANQQISLAAYQAPASSYSDATASQQVLSDQATGTFTQSGNGTHTLTVSVPDCFYQVDFVIGGVIQHLQGNSAGNYVDQGLIDHANGGTRACPPPPPACPASQAAQMTAHSYLITHPDGTTTTVSSLSGHVSPGDTVRVNFTIAAGCTAVQVSLVSYNAPSATFSRDTAGQQTVYQQGTGTFGAGNHSLTVALPGCYYQVDFVFGSVITTLGPSSSTNYYGDQGRAIDNANGGTTACTSTTTPPAGTTPPPGDTTPPPSDSTTPVTNPGGTPVVAGANLVPIVSATGSTPTAVLGAAAAPTVAKAAANLTGAGGCVAKTSLVWVSGVNVKTVTFRINGRVVKTLTHATKGHWSYAVSAKQLLTTKGSLTATVTFAKTTGHAAVVRKLALQKCAVAGAAASPAFTG